MGEIYIYIYVPKSCNLQLMDSLPLVFIQDSLSDDRPNIPQKVQFSPGHKSGRQDSQSGTKVRYSANLISDPSLSKKAYRSHEILEEAFVPHAGLGLLGDLCHCLHAHRGVVSKKDCQSYTQSQNSFEEYFFFTQIFQSNMTTYMTCRTWPYSLRKPRGQSLQCDGDLWPAGSGSVL